MDKIALSAAMALIGFVIYWIVAAEILIHAK